jgi:hypothetical protein
MLLKKQKKFKGEFQWLATNVKIAPSGPSMTAAPDHFWGACGNGTQAGALAGRPTCDHFLQKNGRDWRKSTSLRNINDPAHGGTWVTMVKCRNNCPLPEY